MKIRCPRCNEFVSFTRKDLQEDQRYSTTCIECGKTFSVRLKRKTVEDDTANPVYAMLTVIENEFCHQQIFKIREGKYAIGRMNKGTDIEIPIDTGDMLMDRRHCQLTCSIVDDNPQFQLVDTQSVEGTYVNSKKMTQYDRINIGFDDVVSMGLTSFILKEISEQ